MTRAPHRHEELLVALAARLLAQKLPGVSADLIALACREVLPAVLDRASEIGAVRKGMTLTGKVTEEDRAD